MITAFALAAAASALVVPLPAHATIVGTNPDDGETITTLPEEFSVTANEEILAIDGSSSNQILITDQAGRYYGDGCSVVDGATLSTAGDLGEAGVYTMRYGLVSADGHPIEGVVTFAWQPSGDSPVANGAAQPPTCSATEPEPTASPSTSPEPSESTTPSQSEEPPSSSTAPSTPPTGGESDGDEGGLPPLAWVGIGVALAAAVAGVLVAVFRAGKRRGEEEHDDGSGDDRG